MISFGDTDKVVESIQTGKVASSKLFVNPGPIEISATQDGVLSISGSGVKKVIVYSSYRTIPIVRRNE